VRIAANEAEATGILEARRAALPSLARRGRLTILEDVTVPRARLAEMVERIEAIAREDDLLIGTFGHAGDGNLHPTCVLDPADEAAVQRAHRAFDAIFGAAIELGGTITGEHGVGRAKAQALPDQLGPDVMALTRRVKDALDPDGILNPGAIL